MTPFETKLRTLIADGETDQAVGLAMAIFEQRDRAEAKVTAYLHEIKRLAASFKSITEPATGRPVGETKSDSPRRIAPKKPDLKSAKPDLAVDIEL